MMNNNKILTVSYGTFSCTLEGFDDSFGTMKAIAEYFRDLASDDRYFGAEPPVPDAEMLARIAQKEISRRVEAREHEGKIVLSAMQDSANVEDTSLVAEEPALIERVGKAANIAAAATVDTPDEVDDADVSVDAVEGVADVDHDVSEIVEAAQPDVADEPASAAEPEVAAAPQDDAPDATAPEMDVVEDTETPAIADAVVQDENDIVPGQPDVDVEAFFGAAPQAPDEDEEAFAADQPAPAPVPFDAQAEPNSIAAKLQRIRAVVAQHDGDTEEGDYSEDEHSNGSGIQQEAPADLVSAVSDEAMEEAADDVVADARRDIEDALEADEEHEAKTAQDAFASDDDVDDIAAMLSRMAMDDAEDAPVQEAETAAPTVAEEDENDSLVADLDDADDEAVDNLFDAEDDVRDALLKAAESDEADARDDDHAPVISDDAEEPAAESEEILVLADAQDDADLRHDAAPRARVIKVKRADLDAAIARGELEEYDDEDEDNMPLSLDDLAPARSSNTSLSPEDEDDLARELAALEADIEMEHTSEKSDSGSLEADGVVEDEDEIMSEDQTDAVEQKAEDEGEGDIEVAPAPRAQLPSIDDAKGDNMDRLMAETDHQMGEPESATRRDAFAHLRAAVAAKKADQAMGSDDAAQSGDDAYRSDLADVVRPRRPTGGQARTARPGEGRPAPLKLVAEQRIDIDRPAAASGPVRPRRVAAVVEAPASDLDGEDSFAEFAAEMGATKLPDLLEAAAAYMSFVEGHEQFSRPQLMTKVRQVGSDGFSREDTLRSFGKLLRDGKIEKMKGGRFSASEEIGFRPDQRAAG